MQKLHVVALTSAPGASVEPLPLVKSFVYWIKLWYTVAVKLSYKATYA